MTLEGLCIFVFISGACHVFSVKEHTHTYFECSKMVPILKCVYRGTTRGPRIVLSDVTCIIETMVHLKTNETKKKIFLFKKSIWLLYVQHSVGPNRINAVSWALMYYVHTGKSALS